MKKPSKVFSKPHRERKIKEEVEGIF